MAIRKVLLVVASLGFASGAYAQDRPRPKTVEEELTETDSLAASLRERMSKVTLSRAANTACNEALAEVATVATAAKEDRRRAYKRAERKVTKCNRFLVDLETKTYRDALTKADFEKLALDGISRIRDRANVLRRTTVDPKVLDEVVAMLDEVLVELANNEPRAAFELIEQARDRLKEAEDAVAL